jgi:formate hydrogenlyase transcriptional activator
MERTTELQESNNQLQKAQAELRSEKDRLKLLLNLNNTIVSNLELRELLRVISATVRQMMHCDAASVNLPDPETGELKVYALDFPGAKGFLKEGLLRPADSLSGQVFRTGQAATLLRGATHSAPETNPYEEEGLNSSCSLPLISQQRVLGVLALSRFDALSFSQDDVHFLMQVANQVAIAVQNALSYSEITKLKDSLAQEKLYLEDEIRTEANFEEIIGKSAVLRRVLRQVETVAPTDSTVLIYGETGTGKELIARAIHNLSPRRSRTFVKMNCAAIPTGLLESELFGHERGAFTGAVTQRIGRLEVAHQGSLFLDEIGEIPPEVQPKLLRVLQEREFERLGSTRTLRADVRLIAATNRDLEDFVEQGKFRSDLFFRLNVFPIQMPPLRERPDDIPLLVRHFAQEFSRRMNKIIDTIPSEAMNAMCQYAWPGNIRELQNVIERAVILSQGTTLNVQVSDLPKPHTSVVSTNQNSAPTTKRAPVRNILAEVNRDEIIQALKDAGGRIGGEHGAAARLGLKRTTLISRMKKLGIKLSPAPQDKTSILDSRVM